MRRGGLLGNGLVDLVSPRNGKVNMEGGKVYGESLSCRRILGVFVQRTGPRG